MKRLFTVALVAGGMLAGSVSTVSAATYNWMFDCDGNFCDGSGVLTTDVPIGPANVTSISGSIAGFDIFQLSNYYPTDNLITSLNGQYFSKNGEYYSGILFNTSPYTFNFAVTNIWHDPALGRHRVSSYYNGLNGLVGDLTISPVPLPAAAWLLLSALGGLGFAGWRRRKAVAA